MVAFGHFQSTSDHSGKRGKGSVGLRIAVGFTDTRELPPGDLVLVHLSVIFNCKRSAKDEGSHSSGLKGTELPFSSVTQRTCLAHSEHGNYLYAVIKNVFSLPLLAEEKWE